MSEPAPGHPSTASGASASAAAKPTHAKRQRDALAKLVVLSNQCAQTDHDLEQQHRQKRDAIEQHDKRLKQFFDDRYDAARRLTRRQLDQAIAATKAKAEKDQASLVAQANKHLEDLAGRIESRRSKLREDYQHALWTADSVLEGILNKLKRDKQDKQRQAEGYEQELSALEEQCRAQLNKFRLPQQEIDAAAPPHAEDAPAPAEDPTPDYDAEKAEAEARLARLADLAIPGALSGVKPYAIGLLVAAAGGFLGFILGGAGEPNYLVIIGATAGALVLYGLVLWLLLRLARKQTLAALEPFEQSLSRARGHIEAMLAYYKAKRHEERDAAIAARQETIDSTKAKYEPMFEEQKAKGEAMLADAKQQAEAQIDTRRADAERRVAALAQQRDGSIEGNRAKKKRLLDMAEAKRLERHQRNDQRRTDGLAEVERQWTTGRDQIETEIQRLTQINAQRFPGWPDASWSDWSPPRDFSDVVRFGQLGIDLRNIMTDLARGGRFTLDLPEAFAVPALLSSPHQRSMLIQAGREGREQAIKSLQAVMARLLTAMPPGRVKFTLIDPIGLGQSFAGFMHLADHDESLVTSRIWSEPQHIAARLTDLTEHMENVIQKYLRNDFETIDEYNAQAGELAEPYRFLVVTDFPTGFSAEAIARLASIAASGARCGVFLLIFHDVRQSMPSGTHVEDLQANCVTIAHRDGKWVWNDEIYERFPLTLDGPPPETLLTRIVNTVGEAARDASRVEVPFETISPPQGKRWTRSTVDELSVPVGRTGATRLQSVTLGRGVAQHALVAGKTGSGKSTLLHVLITNLALWHHPDEVEFYLIDFKKGVEFKAYADLGLPHARAIAIESDREFGLSVLQRLDAELESRGELFRKHGVQNLSAYRALPDSTPGKQTLPRTLLLIDEFHEFFSEDDKIAQDAALLLDRLVRQGRAFGIHAFLGSQSLGGALGLGRGTLGQMAVRIALQCSEADSQLILNDDNGAARLLTRPGEAIYNDQGGALEGNSPFQISWLSDAKRDQYVREAAALATQQNVKRPPTIVFEGNAPAELEKNQPLAALLDGEGSDQLVSGTHPGAGAGEAWIGEPVAIKEPTALVLRRQAGANALIIGQQDEAALAMFTAAMISLAVQYPADRARFVLFDGSTADSPLFGRLAAVAEALPHETRDVAWRDTEAAIADLAAEVKRRLDLDDAADEPPIFAFIYGLQRYRMLRKGEDDFSFSMDDDAAAPKPDKQFAEILKEGPAVGVHLLAWCDTPISVDRTIDRSLMREFDYRVLFQMSATDSSNLIDTPAANTLGLYRAICYSEERGTMEKFRPYALPSGALLDRVRDRLKATAPAAE